MRMKLGALSLAFILILTGCIPALERSEEDVIIVEETEEEEETEYIITPTIESPDHFFRNVLVDGEYQRSPARGTVADTMNNMNLNQFELGLMEIASSYYDQEEYYFREGGFLSGDRINRWLRRYNEDEDRYVDGLNPPFADEEERVDQMGEAPIVLSHIMEHNYYTGSEEDGVNLGGVVIGIGLNAVYYFNTEADGGGTHFHERTLDREYALEYGQQAAQTILQRLRELDEDLEDVPVTFALFQEEPNGSVVPGTFTAMAHAPAGSDSLGNWENISEDYVVFPSGRARDIQPNLSGEFAQFREEVEDFFGRQVGVVGKGRYKNEILDELKIELNLQSHGKAEIVALTQFISGRLDNAFTPSAPVYVYVESVSGTESLIVQYPDQDPYIHVYR